MEPHTVEVVRSLLSLVVIVLVADQLMIVFGAKWNLRELLFMCWVRETGMIPATARGGASGGGVAFGTLKMGTLSMRTHTREEGENDMKPFNALTRKDGGKDDMIAFDNPDDAPEDIPAAAQGSDEQLVAVDSPDDFEDEGEPEANGTL